MPGNDPGGSPWERFIAPPDSEFSFFLPAGSNEVIAPEAVAHMVGTTMFLHVVGTDERSYPYMVMEARVIQDGKGYTLTLKPMQPYQPTPT
jgi:hypothetical protein